MNALVAARLQRRPSFDQEDPPDVAAVLDEAVLDRLIGSPQVMNDALAHGPVLTVEPAEWRSFIAAVKAGRPDLT